LHSPKERVIAAGWVLSWKDLEWPCIKLETHSLGTKWGQTINLEESALGFVLLIVICLFFVVRENLDDTDIPHLPEVVEFFPLLNSSYPHPLEPTAIVRHHSLGLHGKSGEVYAVRM
jgi:hypothetical protein